VTALGDLVPAARADVSRYLEAYHDLLARLG
jgi:hypothetical protein